MPKSLQDRLLEHLDRLTDYGQVREKIISLVQSRRDPDAMDCSLVTDGEAGSQSGPFQVEERTSWPEPPEDYTEEEEAMDLAALADVKCHRCGKKGHMIRNCPQRGSGPQRGPGGQFKPRFAPYSGPSQVNRQTPPSASGKPTCPTCKNGGHTKEELSLIHI